MSTSTHGGSPQDHATENPPAPSAFVTTHWSVVLSARDKTSPQSVEALEQLCRAYWYPLYAYVRRQGHPPHDAEDLTQAFFARLLRKNYLDAADRERGRFRSFLLVALKRFLANEWDRARAQKRGGGQPLLSLDTDLAERQYRTEPAAADVSAERMYERRWALTLVNAALAQLRAEFERSGKVREFEHLKAFLTEDRAAIPYLQVAAALGVSEGTARVAVHRLRKRFREVFREKIAQTVDGPQELEDEIRHLMTVLGG